MVRIIYQVPGMCVLVERYAFHLAAFFWSLLRRLYSVPFLVFFLFIDFFIVIFCLPYHAVVVFSYPVRGHFTCLTQDYAINFGFEFPLSFVSQSLTTAELHEYVSLFQLIGSGIRGRTLGVLMQPGRKDAIQCEDNTYMWYCAGVRFSSRVGCVPVRTIIV